MDSKKDIISLRVPPDVRMMLGEVAESTGTSVSSVIKAGICRLLGDMYDMDGTLLPAGARRARARVSFRNAYCRINDIAKAYGIKEKNIRNLIARGRASTLRKDKILYVLLSDVERAYGSKDEHE